MIAEPKIKTITSCYHCGEDCETTNISIEEKTFCCEGCKMVYEIISGHNLCEYYTLSDNPGTTQKRPIRKNKFAFLDDISLQKKLLEFESGSQAHYCFYIPQMHCNSCIWILEHLPKINSGILNASVNFPRKEVSVVFDRNKISFRETAELLYSIGYEPYFSLNDLNDKAKAVYSRSRILKIGIAGFAFGNVMMMSFPEYFSSGEMDTELKRWFSWINLALALPVFFYSSAEFFINGWKGLKQRFLNIDAPIALAVLITFLRSVFEIVSGTGAGYLDSMTGIVFFMLVGRYFQDKTNDTLSFNRDYTSYFPIGITVINEDGTEKQIPVSDIQVGHRIKIHSEEIIPADAILFLGKARIDYSFVTGESEPVERSIGEIIYAGGKQTGGSLELEVVKDVSQSYLTRLWNNKQPDHKQESNGNSFVHILSRYFTIILFSIAAAGALFWSLNDPSKILDSVTAVLIVACPCALLLSATFTNGNALRLLSRAGIYFKNAEVMEHLAKVDTIVFDKTGTITVSGDSTITYHGRALSEKEIQIVLSLVSQSNHPLSRALAKHFGSLDTVLLREFMEEKGNGLKAMFDGKEIRIGSARFCHVINESVPGETRVYLNLDGEIFGYFSFSNKYRKGLPEVIEKLREDFRLHLLTGDHEGEIENLRLLFGEESEIRFRQLPADKLNYVKKLQEEGRRVLMIGDGLNDAGALFQSNVGIAISDDINNFSPACDAILEGKSLPYLPGILRYSRLAKQVIITSFVISILYNIIGISYAVSANLQPVIAAILMPASSISILLVTTGLTGFFSWRIFNKKAGT